MRTTCSKIYSHRLIILLWVLLGAKQDPTFKFNTVKLVEVEQHNFIKCYALHPHY